MTAHQHEVNDLPADVLVYLLGSRYCDTQRLDDIAWQISRSTRPGWPRVQAICDFVHDRIAFDYQKASPTRTAYDGYVEREGVCRDFAHLAIALCRCMNIPARYCTGYLGDIGIPPVDYPDGFQRLVRGLSRGSLVHVRRPAQHAADRPDPDGDGAATPPMWRYRRGSARPNW